MTVNDEIKFTFHPASPMIDELSNKEFADSIIDILEVISGSKDIAVKESSNPLEGKATTESSNSLEIKAIALVGSVALLSHAGGFIQFYQSMMEMKSNADPADFRAALNFWIFFAVGHPILQPILWISDVLHGSPGPMIADLVPATFLAANVIAIAAFTFSKKVRLLFYHLQYRCQCTG
jgi:hypothetical protein